MKVIPAHPDEFKDMLSAQDGNLSQTPVTKEFAREWDNRMGDNYSPALFAAYKEGFFERANDPEEAHKAWGEGTLSDKEALKAMNVTRLPSLYPRLKEQVPLTERVERMKKGEKFEGSNFSTRPVKTTMGIPAVGYLAFSVEEVGSLKAQGKEAILVTEDFDLSMVENFGNIEAVIYIGNDFEHLRSLTDNYGIRAIDLGNYHNSKAIHDEETGELSGFSIEDTTVVINGKHPAKDFMAREPFSIHNDGGLEHEIMVLDEHAELEKYEKDIMEWLEDARIRYDGLGVNINADSAMQLEAGMKAGGEALGLARSENMVLSADVVEAFKQAILAEEEGSDLVAVESHMTEHLKQMFEVANEYEVPSMAIRLFDPNLEELLSTEEFEEVKKQLGDENLSGVQLGLKKPLLYQANIRAILSAAKQKSYKGKVEIIVPHIRTAEEFVAIKKMVKAQAQDLGVKEPDLVPMVETLEIFLEMPRVVQMAKKRYYGTNDLTQQITAIQSRTSTDATKYFEGRIEESITQTVKSPFVALTKTPLELIAGMEAEARRLNPTSEGCICGAQAIDPETVDALHRENIANVSVPSTHIRAVKAYAGKAAANYSQRLEVEMVPTYGAGESVFLRY
jgi:hypothetical protein